jgi:hypothetical protein
VFLYPEEAKKVENIRGSHAGMPFVVFWVVMPCGLAVVTNISKECIAFILQRESDDHEKSGNALSKCEVHRVSKI